jgi:hypothetical protein
MLDLEMTCAEAVDRHPAAVLEFEDDGVRAGGHAADDRSRSKITYDGRSTPQNMPDTMRLSRTRNVHGGKIRGKIIGASHRTGSWIAYS